MNITAKKVLKFTLLPGIVPLLRDLFAGGFGHIAFFMAQIYGAVRLLPANHPYLNPANQGRFGVRHVVAAAANNLKFDRAHADQVAIFILLLVGIGLLFLQFLFLGLSFFMHRAHANGLPPGLAGMLPTGLLPTGASSTAMPTSFAGFFGTPDPFNDLAFILLDRVFGVPGVFKSCVSYNMPCLLNFNPNAAGDGVFPWPYHLALQSVFSFYSYGMLVIAVIIFLYFIVAVAAETAQTGTPFGQRFSKVWAPIRMVVALGLLIPVANGLNSAQYIVLYAAKWGSGFATNGWLLYANAALPQTAGTSTAGVTDHMIANPNPPDLTNLLEYNTVLQTCWAANKQMKTQNPANIQGYFVGDSSNPQPRQMITSDTTYQNAIDFYKGHDIRIVFGACQLKNNNTGAISNCPDGMGSNVPGGYTLLNSDETGGIKPICGEIDMKAMANNQNGADAGAYAVQSEYFNMVIDMWMGSDSPEEMDAEEDDTSSDQAAMEDWGLRTVQYFNSTNNTTALPSAADVQTVHGNFDTNMKNIVAEGVNAANNVPFYNNAQELGWAGAAIWYNKIAQMNGSLVTAVDSLPTVAHYPEVMEDVREQKAQSNTNSGGPEVFNPSLANNQPFVFRDAENGSQIAQVLYQATKIWPSATPAASENTIEDFVKNLFGVHGLFDMQKQVDVQPLAQLAMLGKTLVERGIDTVAAGGAGALGGGVASYLGYGKTASIVQQVSSVMVKLSIVAISAGFLLFYVIPFLPFLYFFFATSTWIKGIFEAMVGVPLWALAHIRIDGEGVQGPVAGQGYLLILEIFLRPILIVFGLLASVIFFTAEVRVLQDIWSLVTSNIGGYNLSDALDANGNPSATAAAAGQTGSLTEFRGMIDQFFYTIMYAVVVYMLGSSAFKLIFLLPNGIMRWLGAGGVTAFNDDGAQIAEGVVSKLQLGIDQVNNLSQSTVSGVNKISSDMGTSRAQTQARQAQQARYQSDVNKGVQQQLRQGTAPKK